MSDSNKYYLIKQRAVPEVLLKVLEAKRLLESGASATIQEATENENSDIDELAVIEDDSSDDPSGKLEAADPKQYSDSYKLYGAWEVKKVYLHLGDTETIYMDWRKCNAFLYFTWFFWLFNHKSYRLANANV